jgi:hypothetical protein
MTMPPPKNRIIIVLDQVSGYDILGLWREGFGVL